MSDKHFVGLDLVSFEDKKKIRPVSRVTFLVDNENSVTAGDDTGLEIVANNPHATQAMANAVLSRLRGYEYHAFEAGSANLDPAAELGDGITAGSVYGFIGSLNDDGNGYLNVSAPGESELEEEYPSDGPMTQAFNRKIAQTRSYIEKTAGEIKLGIEGIEGEISGIVIDINGISSTVENAKGDISRLKQTAENLESKIQSADGNISEIKQSINNISLSVSNGFLGNKAAITLTSGEHTSKSEIDLSGVRSAFAADDKSAITISAGTVEFSSNTLIVNSSNLQIDSKGNLTAENGVITGASITSGTKDTNIQLSDGRLSFVREYSDVGRAGTNSWSGTSDHGIAFELNSGGSYLAWANYERNYYASKLLYTNTYLRSGGYSYSPDKIYFECDAMSRNVLYFGEDPQYPAGYIWHYQGGGLEVQAYDGPLHLYSDEPIAVFNDINMNRNDIYNQSDERLKTNIESPDVSGLDIINKTKLYQFDWIESNKHEDIGFIAQQLEAEVDSSFVNINKDNGVYEIREMHFIPYLVKAVQELYSMLNKSIGIQTIAISEREKWRPANDSYESKLEFIKNAKLTFKNKHKTVRTEPTILSEVN